MSPGASSWSTTVGGRGVFLSPSTIEGSWTRGSQSPWFCFVLFFESIQIWTKMIALTVCQ